MVLCLGVGLGCGLCDLLPSSPRWEERVTQGLTFRTFLPYWVTQVVPAGWAGSRGGWMVGRVAAVAATTAALGWEDRSPCANTRQSIHTIRWQRPDIAEGRAQVVTCGAGLQHSTIAEELLVRARIAPQVAGITLTRLAVAAGGGGRGRKGQNGAEQQGRAESHAGDGGK